MDSLNYNSTSFFVAGAERSGNASIFQCLNDHPLLSLRSLAHSGYFAKDFQFEHGQPKNTRYDAANGLDHKHLIYGEVSSNYLHHPNAITRIFHYNSKAKIIISLRNPAERAFSHWQSEVYKGKEQRTFHQAIQDEIKSLNSYSIDQSTRSKYYIHQSSYADQIDLLRQYFDPHQLLFIKSEDLRDDTEVIMYQILQFLGVPFIDIECSAQNVGYYNCSLNVRDKVIIQQFLKHEIQQTQQLLNWDCSDWLDAIGEKRIHQQSTY